MRLPASVVLTLSLVALAGLALGASSGATVGSVEGKVMVEPAGGGAPKGLATGDDISEGDTISLGAGSKLAVSFSDGSVMDVTGPAQFSMVSLTLVYRTIDLKSGTINRFQVKDITTGVTTPLDAFVAVRNGDIYVEAGATETSDRVVFKLFDGEGAKIVQGGKASVMHMDKPVVVERKRSTPIVALPPAEPRTAGAGGSLVIKVGRHTIFIAPKSGATVENTRTGGVKVTSTVAEGEYLVVMIDGDQTLYLANGEWVEFDEEGVVIRQNGISHVYAALDLRGIYDEAVADPSDSSFTGTKNP